MKTIILTELTEQVEQGWKKEQLAEHYGLPASQVTALLKEAGLKIRRFHRPKYVLVKTAEEATTLETSTVGSEEANAEITEHTAVVDATPVQEKTVVNDPVPVENQTANIETDFNFKKGTEEDDSVLKASPAPVQGEPVDSEVAQEQANSVFKKAWGKPQ